MAKSKLLGVLDFLKTDKTYFLFILLQYFKSISLSLSPVTNANDAFNLFCAKFFIQSIFLEQVKKAVSKKTLFPNSLLTKLITSERRVIEVIGFGKRYAKQTSSTKVQNCESGNK